jgi:hypothetical protein
MKLRIRGNSIRFRLGQSEVCRLATEGMIEELTDFGPHSGQRLGYALHATFQDPDIRARFVEGRVVVSIPALAIHKWARTDQVGISAIQPIDDEHNLKILIEKDFECVDRSSDASAESQEDAFPNPQLRCA